MYVQGQRNGGKRQGEKGRWPCKSTEALKSQLSNEGKSNALRDACRDVLNVCVLGVWDWEVTALHLRNQSS